MRTSALTRTEITVPLIDVIWLDHASTHSPPPSKSTRSRSTPGSCECSILAATATVAACTSWRRAREKTRSVASIAAGSRRVGELAVKHLPYGELKHHRESIASSAKGSGGRRDLSSDLTPQRTLPGARL